MLSSQTWRLSQEANKASGVCSVCLNVRQLHLKDGLVHRHGPRHKPCAGSHKPPLAVTSSQTDSLDCGAQNSQQEVASSCQFDLAGSGPSSMPNLESVALSGVKCMPSVTCSFASASSDVSRDTREHPVWFSSYSSGIIKHIPKSARSVCASHLAGLFNQVVTHASDIDRWFDILCWPKTILFIPKRGGKRHNISSELKKRICAWPSDGARPHLPHVLGNDNSHKHPPSLSEAVSAKLEDGNIKAAVRILCSDEQPALPSVDILAALQAKHPAAHKEAMSVPGPQTDCQLVMDEQAVLRVLRSFPAGSSGGPDGLRPQHLLDLVRCRESGSNLLTSLTGFVNMVLSGSCPSQIIPLFFGARLIALNKKSGGVRPIAVGCVLRRLIAKCAVSFSVSKLVSYFSPRQLGVGIHGGCEAAVHAARRFLSTLDEGSVLAKLDFSNAFNCIHRDAVLLAVHDKLPEIFNFCHLAYAQSSLLVFGDFQILSEEGIQQGDPLGPLLFCLTIQPLLSSLQSSLTIGFMDDVTLGGRVDVVANDIQHINCFGATLGLNLNITKCELISSSVVTPPFQLLKSFILVLPADATLLGAPCLAGRKLDIALDACCLDLQRAIERLSLLESHDALVLLRSCFSASKLMYLLRCSPCYGHPKLDVFDNLLKDGLSRITNTDLNEIQWLQASLPVRFGGIGVRRVASLAISAYLASAASTLELQNSLLSDCQALSDVTIDGYSSIWSKHFGPPPSTPAACKQRAWDQSQIEADKLHVLSSYIDPYHRARLTAVMAPHSGDWLFALPVSSCGLRLSNDAVRVAVGLRLGVKICEAHTCSCGQMVDVLGTHSLSCKHAPGRSARHHNLNDVVVRALAKAGIPVQKEPLGLVRTDGKRPDGVTLIPWQHGRCLTWDVTVVNSVASSYISVSQRQPAGAAEAAAARKESKYAILEQSYLFQPLAFETLGPLNASAIDFINSIGRRLRDLSDDSRETSFLFQRLSICVQRFNSVILQNSFVGDCRGGE